MFRTIDAMSSSASSSAPHWEVLEKHDYQPEDVEARLQVPHSINATPKPLDLNLVFRVLLDKLQTRTV